MSGLIPIGFTIAQANALGLISPTIIQPRSIAGFTANVTTEELATDELEITDHPVEQGASITDHAFKRPAQIKITTGWSNSSAGGVIQQVTDLIQAPSVAGFLSPQYVTEIYQRFLALQASRQPFTVVTGKRTYNNMLIKNLTQLTDEKWENALNMVCEYREIILVQTVVTQLPNASVMKTPQVNAPVQNAGSKNAIPAPNYRSE